MKRLLCSAFVACLAISTPAGAQGVPGPQTIPPTDIATGAADPSETSAMVLGYFNSGSTTPPGIAKSCWFEYGTTGAFGGRADAVCSGTTKATLAPLTPGTYYYYRAVAANEAGTTWGPTKSFTTLGTAPAAPAPPAQDLVARLKVTSGQSLGSVRRKGLRARIDLAGPCPCTVRAQLTSSRKGLGASLAVARREFAAPTIEELTLKLRRSVTRKLRRARRLTARLRVTITSPAGQTIVLERRLRLTRR
jgi:hypothetical protein